jgi:N-acetylglucosaminyl-diphospho-decaprenol L-rhamnosyltransferase
MEESIKAFVEVKNLVGSILIISYNTKSLTLDCIQSALSRFEGMACEIIVVDNASTDGSADAIAVKFPQVKLIRSDENVGFAAANNLAAQHSRADWLLLLNPDTLVLDGAIDRLLAFAQTHPEASIFGGRTLFADRSLNPFSCWRRPTLWSMFCIGTGLTSFFRNSDLFNPEAYGGWQRDTVRQVEVVSGCFLLIRRSLWDRLGGFDPTFFMYAEEVDLCWRATNLGETCLICPDAQIIHYGGASEKVRADAMVKIFSAKARLFSKYWSRPSQWFGIRMLDVWALSRTVSFAVCAFVNHEKVESYRTWRSVWRQRQNWRSL